jgi:hypothetical protein
MNSALKTMLKKGIWMFGAWKKRTKYEENCQLRLWRQQSELFAG